ncbi:glycosyltransferase [Sphingobacterium detergens]|uniref:glycosyltransferase n=1 Tax=Sphingobacterium detergens TaxID=1145106 RepID=UPI003AABC9F6
MKIMHIVPSLNRGGAERFVVDLCNELSKKEQVFLVTMFDNVENSFVDEVSKNVTLISLGKRAGFDIRIFRRIRRLLKELNPDVINSHLNTLEYLVPSVLLESKIRFFHTLHSVAEKEALNRYVIYFRKMLFQKRVIPITISPIVHKSFVEVYGLNDRDCLIMNGRPKLQVDEKAVHEIIQSFSVHRDSKLFVSVGRISAVKNQLALVKAFKRFNNEQNNMHTLIVLGDVQDERLYQELVAEIQNCCEHIFLLGGKSNVADYLAASDAFCLVSLYEGMPISVIEAFCIGCIPLCTPVGGIVDMIEDQVTGYLASGVSVDSLYHNFQRFVESGHLDSIRKNIQESFNLKYHISITAGIYLNSYKTIC